MIPLPRPAASRAALAVLLAASAGAIALAVEPAAAGRRPYFLQEAPDMDNPSSYYLMPANDGKPHSVLWCDTADDWDQILKIDGVRVADLTRAQILAEMFPADGHPVQVTVRPRTGPVRSFDCVAAAPGTAH